MKTQKTGIVFVVALVLLLAVSSVIAHDFWLVPEFFSVPSGLNVRIYAHNGSVFPTSLNAVAKDRIAYAKIVGKDKTLDITTMRPIETSLVLDVKPPTDGQWIIGVETKPKSLEQTGKEFNEYLEHDGMPSILELREERGELDKAVTEMYQKSAKTLIQSGDGGPKSWDMVLNHHIEFIPLSDPAKARRGSTLRFKLLFKGKPISNAVVSSGYAGQDTHTHDAGDEHSHAFNYKTDSNGVVGIKIGSRGKWYIETTHMIEVKDETEIDWHSFWATMTFEVK